LILAVALCFLCSPKVRYLAACIALAVTLAGFVIAAVHLMPVDYVVVPPVRSFRTVPLGSGSVQLTPRAPAGFILGLLTGLPCAQVETILLHELTHIRRHDYLVNLLRTFAEGLLFSPGGVVDVARRTHRARELL